MGFSWSASMVKRGLNMRRKRKTILALAFFPVFLLSLVLLVAFLGTRSYNLVAAFVFAVLFGAIPFLLMEALMLLPVKFLQYKLESDPTQVIELACSPQTASSRVWRVFAERKIQARYLKHFTGHEGFVLGFLGGSPSKEDETIISFEPFFAVQPREGKGGVPIAAMYYEKDGQGLTLAEVMKAKLKIA